MSLAVKICGLSTRETLDAALDAGAGMVGFVFFPPSPRHLALDVARELGQQVKRRALKAALTVNADDATLAGIVDVSSGVERAPGVTDIAMIRDFIRAARATDLSSPLPVYGERSGRVRDPGEGESSSASLSSSSILQKEPLTPTLSPQARG